MDFYYKSIENIVVDVKCFFLAKCFSNLKKSQMGVIAIEDVAKLPQPGMNIPSHININPDNTWISYLHSEENELSRQLYGINMKTQKKELLTIAPDKTGNTEDNLSLEEKLRRERQRQLGVGITSYVWSPVKGSMVLLLPIQGNLYIQRALGESLELLFDKHSTGLTGGAIDPQFSPNGKYVAFVQQDEIYIISTGKGRNRAIQITSDARGTGKTNGLACFLTQEELSRFRGFWWSADSRSIAFEQVDETHLPQFTITHSGKDVAGPEAEEQHRYPFAGGPNPKRRVAVIQIRTDEQDEMHVPVWMNTPQDWEGFYFSRINWLPDGSLAIQQLNRLQTSIRLLKASPKDGSCVQWLEESSDVWLNANFLFRTLDTKSDGTIQFIWGSERSGYMHLYMYQVTTNATAATLLGPLTQGEWTVETLEGVKEAENVLYCTGTYDSPLERHLYAVSLDGKCSVHRLTRIPGMHTIVMNTACTFFVAVHSAINIPPNVHVYPVPPQSELSSIENFYASQTILPIHSGNDDARVQRLESELKGPELVKFRSADDQVTLYGAIYHPDTPGPHPLMVSVYGGPHVQRVSNAWNMNADMRAQKLRQQGYMVLKVDNRGSFRRGLAFEGAIKHSMGTIEIQDQETGVQYLMQRGLIDPKRVGIFGWSYGGYMSLMCLLKAGQTFKLAIAGAPVTSWDGYDTCYTERYMSLPQLNQLGYEKGDVMKFVDALQESQHLLLVHGLIDENVHFRHTARLINALIKHRKRYDILVFPNERHSPRGLQDRIYMEERMLEYIIAHL